MIELRNSCMNSIILSYIYLPCWIRDIGVEVYKSLGSFQGRMRGLRLSSETSSSVMIELNHISVTNRSYCNTSRKNLVDNASCVWIVVLLQNIDDLIVHIYLARKVDQKRIVPVFLSDKPIRPKIFVQLLKSDFLKFDLLIVNLYYLSSSLLKEVNAVTVIHAKICLQVEPVLPVMLFVTCQTMQNIDWQNHIRYSR